MIFDTYSKEIVGIIVAFLSLVLPKLGVPVLDNLPEIVTTGVGFLALVLAYIGRIQKGDVGVLGKRKV